MACSVAVHLHDGVPVVTVAGEVDIGTAVKVSDAFAEASRTPSALIVFDLSGLTFCDSSGVRVLEQSVRTAAEVGTRVVLAAPGRSVRHVLRVSGLDDYFTIARSVPEALAGERPDSDSA